ncbi:RsmB/NOP family class I SAM-dependent RNA methyltransferase [Actinomyces wuliandei]|uniref:RsmB/NOP family class I SAM-dependent RNA methyltransferase n=1 Tax=Actinomyces wuliandei TaxID=2057743 RepID=UPI000FD82287|nr:transcription antitermination factor NusB [Actinomyces wuliandei]
MPGRSSRDPRVPHHDGRRRRPRHGGLPRASSGRGGSGAPGRTQGRRTQGFREADPARTIALEVLTRVRTEGAFANLVLPSLVEEARLSRLDAGFATALTYGTLRLQGRYDAIVGLCLNQPTTTLDGVVLDVLRLGAHQLLGMRVPAHAAVSTSVDLVGGTSGHRASGLVNAVLRRVGRRSVQEWLARLHQDADHDLEALAATESHPLWVVKALRQALLTHDRSAEELGDLLSADNQDPEVVLCARPGLVSVPALVEEVSSGHGQRAQAGRVSPLAVVMGEGDPGRVTAVAQARAGVEDEGSQLVALLLAQASLEGSDSRWLDMCAGPGGKAALLGSLAAQRGARLVANEPAAHRAELVRAAARALPPGSIEVRCGDGRDIGSQEPGSYDRVLVDAPCSGLGSLRRRPESRWRRTQADVTELAVLQRELLSSALSAVRPGGVVAYVTCSPHVLETVMVVQDVLRRLERGGSGNREDEEGRVVEVLHAGHLSAEVARRPPVGASRPMLQLWPHLDGTDAMFCALLRPVCQPPRPGPVPRLPVRPPDRTQLPGRRVPLPQEPR